MKNTLYLNWHRGLGDAFICTGLVRRLAERYQNILLPAKPHNVASVKSLFQDVPKVRIIRTDLECVRDWTEVEKFCHTVGIAYLGLGYKTKARFNSVPWELEFYMQANVDPRERWTGALFPEDWTRQHDAPPYAFVHDDGLRGFGIYKVDTKLALLRPDPHHPIEVASRLMVNAEEIHCIDSSFLNLAEGMFAKGLLKAKRLVFHKYARPGGYPPQALRAPWEVVE